MKQKLEQVIDDMKLPEGKTCADCIHWKRTCEWLISDLDGTETSCDWSPSKFREKTKLLREVIASDENDNTHKADGHSADHSRNDSTDKIL